ncbi:hypothetical protein E2C01_020941 [Portunus trituberculatus]|uniref:Uncharacterized protein n=1 Tax=Portunus trituberculatus TaxID=210409 RepID=A0A5B7E185_PORTR|nr:hypothetical protein [Portunus trituberculatus]
MKPSHLHTFQVSDSSKWQFEQCLTGSDCTGNASRGQFPPTIQENHEGERGSQGGEREGGDSEPTGQCEVREGGGGRNSGRHQTSTLIPVTLNLAVASRGTRNTCVSRCTGPFTALPGILGDLDTPSYPRRTAGTKFKYRAGFQTAPAVPGHRVNR